MESSTFWNPESTVLESGIQYPESGIHSMESRIQDCPGFPYMGRRIRSVTFTVLCELYQYIVDKYLQIVHQQNKVLLIPLAD